MRLGKNGVKAKIRPWNDEIRPAIYVEELMIDNLILRQRLSAYAVSIFPLFRSFISVSICHPMWHNEREKVYNS
jgi:hypothetical protein